MRDINKIREDIRMQLMKQVKKQGLEDQIIEKIIPFTNDDVPKYLRFLEKLEKYSKESKIMVGSSYERVA